MKFETLLAMAAGAFAYHVYSEIQAIKAALEGGQVISLSALLDIAETEENTVEDRKFGFHK